MEISEDDLGACVRVLRAIEADRSHLTRLTQEQRRELLTLAGLVAKPERHDLVRMAKAFRRAERKTSRPEPHPPEPYIWTTTPPAPPDASAN